MEVRLLVDTNRLTDALKGEPDAVATFEQADEIRIPFVAAAELKAGFAFGARMQANELLFAKLLRLPQVDLLFADAETINIYGSIFAFLKRQGTPIPTNDIWIAALSIQHGLHLYSRDRHFERLPQVPRWQG